MHNAFLSRCLVLGALLALIVLPGVTRGETVAPQATTLAVFGDAIAQNPAPDGWRFLWNANGPLGQPDAYAPLQYDPGAQTYGVINEQGKLSDDHPSGSRHVTIKVMAAGQRDLAFIASYTLPRDTTGRLWLNHVNFRNRSFATGVRLAIYVNHQLREDRLIPRDRMATVFQTDLGPGKAGDVIDVAVAPGPDARQGGGKLYFVLHDVPEGAQPPAPVAIATPGVDDVVPQLGSNGEAPASYRDLLKRHNDELVARRAELVFVGDSITARWPQELLEAHFGKWRPVIMGGGGDWVQNTRWRMQHSTLDQARPRLAIVLIGTNNVTHSFTPQEVAAMTRALVADIRAKSPRTRVLVQGILPRGRSIAEPVNQAVKATNAQLAGLADDKNVFFIDIGGVLVEPDGAITAEVMPDRLHVAMPGYLRWVEAIKPTIERLLALPEP